jgi:hypothetical protein
MPVAARDSPSPGTGRWEQLLAVMRPWLDKRYGASDEYLERQRLRLRKEQLLTFLWESEASLMHEIEFLGELGADRERALERAFKGFKPTV